MVKKGLMPVLLLILPCLLYAAGNQEKELLIPPDSSWVMKLDPDKILKSEIGNRILNELAPELVTGSTGANGSNLIDNLLERMLGLKLENAGTLIVFGAGSSLESGQAGAIITLKDIAVPDVVDTIKAHTAFSLVAYRKTEYYRFDNKSSPFYLYPLKSRLLLSLEAPVMEKMLNVLGNADDVSRNKRLFKLINQYKKEMFCLVGFIPGDYVNAETALFSEIRDFGLRVRLTAEAAFRLELNCSNSDSAENIANFIKLTLSMAEKSIPREYEALKGIIKQLLQPLEISAAGTAAIIEVVYTQKELDLIAEALPVITGNMGY